MTSIEMKNIVRATHKISKTHYITQNAGQFRVFIRRNKGTFNLPGRHWFQRVTRDDEQNMDDTKQRTLLILGLCCSQVIVEKSSSVLVVFCEDCVRVQGFNMLCFVSGPSPNWISVAHRDCLWRRDKSSGSFDGSVAAAEAERHFAYHSCRRIA